MDDLLALLDYHTWAVDLTVRALTPLSAEEFGRDLGGSHGGVQGTLAHLYGSDLIWAARLSEQAPPAFPGPGDLPASGDLLALWSAALAARRARVATLNPEQRLHYSNLRGEAMVSRVGEMVRHLVNHGAYHRGQLVTFLRQLGYAAPNTDLIGFYRARERTDQS